MKTEFNRQDAKKYLSTEYTELTEFYLFCSVDSVNSVLKVILSLVLR